MAIVIRLLGPLEALVDDEPVDLGGPQQRAVVAFLAVRAGTPVRVGAIEDLIWGETPPSTANKIVQTYVSRLRKLLGADTILSARDGYVLDGGVEVDADRFRQLLRQGHREEALSLWRGPALADVPALHFEGRRLDELRVTALEERFESELGSGGGPALVDELETLVEEHPTREGLLGQLVLALYRSGRQSDALARLRSGRDALDEVGLEPGVQLRDLERQILQHDPSLLPAGPADVQHPALRGRRWWPVAAAIVVVAIVAGALAIPNGHGRPTTVPIKADTLLQYDPKTASFIRSFPVARDPAALDATSTALWIASERDATVSRIDLKTDRVTTIGEVDPVAFLTHDDRGNIYASDWDHPFVWQINPRTVQVVHTYRVKTRALGLSVGGGSLWVADRLANGLTRIDLARRRVAETIKTGVNPLASTFGYGAVWVADGDSGTVAVIRPGAPRAIIRGIPSPYGISAGDGGVWVASNGEHAVYRIDPDTRSIVARIPLGTPFDFLTTVYAGVHGVWAIEDHHVVQINPADDRVVARIRFPAGTEPKAVTATAGYVWITVGDPKDDR